MIGHSPIYAASVCATLCGFMPSISLSGDTVYDDEPNAIVAELVAIETDMAAIGFSFSTTASVTKMGVFAVEVNPRLSRTVSSAVYPPVSA